MSYTSALHTHTLEMVYPPRLALNEPLHYGYPHLRSLSL